MAAPPVEGHSRVLSLFFLYSQEFSPPGVTVFFAPGSYRGMPRCV